MAIIQTEGNSAAPATQSGDIAQSGAATPQASGGGSGSNFVNLQDYVSANQGKGEAFGQNLTGQMAGAVQKAGNSANVAGDSVRNSTRTWNEGLASAGVKNPRALTAQEKSQWREQFTAGPGSAASIEDQQAWKDAQEQNAQIQNRAKLDLGTASGLQQYTGEFGTGKNAFNSAILQGSGVLPGVQQNIQAQAQGLSRGLGELQSNLPAQMQAKREAYTQGMARTAGDVAAKIKELGNPFSVEAAAAKKAPSDERHPGPDNADTDPYMYWEDTEKGKNLRALYELAQGASGTYNPNF